VLLLLLLLLLLPLFGGWPYGSLYCGGCWPKLLPPLRGRGAADVSCVLCCGIAWRVQMQPESVMPWFY
jgi:hypothetical protein